MLKPAPLHVGDHVAVVSLSSGTLGELTQQHQLNRGLKRMRQLGLVPVMMPNALKGRLILQQRPELRAADLKAAFLDPSIRGVVAAIGGDDTYRTVPFLMADEQFKTAVRRSPKLFTGFSDTTINHLMFYQLGLQTFYGPNFLSDLAELGPTMLPYTTKTWQRYFENPQQTSIISSPVWYDERTNFSESAQGTRRMTHTEMHHYEVLRGHGTISGTLLGGCLDSFYDLLTTTRYPDERQVAEQFRLIPCAAEWRGKILFIETSDAQPQPDLFKRMLQRMRQAEILTNVAAVIVGKPQNEHYYQEYRQILIDETADLKLPILYNINFGHALPRTALPYGAQVCIDFEQATLKILEPWFVEA
ncbi:carboxypeptidase [Lactiplantibacillus plantarum subsp. plantarum]|uniref:S66 family peptidase n=1 Tax=Lactiplantibacillus plantarum TaxID=1590 RepID=UPI0006A737F0|nr:S66 peptidase family protein [Lactiplantibacillus plantarum]ASI62771.1 carboxypeptidase [Lactiplantibacillus plantarum subsp. plantarum]KAE9507634.1 Microcin C7 self-immunity protein MccF [Lactiplantibacillus plantarum]UOC10071.1 LD-carboxypeptidase [Lactiplantibacillus plantarum]BBA80436.1 MccC family protein [Lactiplantibacillus plantarum]